MLAIHTDNRTQILHKNSVHVDSYPNVHNVLPSLPFSMQI